MADVLLELENMVANITHAFGDDQIESFETQRWQKLFGFSPSQAKEHIKNHRADLGRSRVSQELWQLVRTEKETEGHSRESYEFSLRHAASTKPPTPARNHSQHCNKTYILKLEAPLESAEQVQAAAQLSCTPTTTTGTGDTGTSTFCTIDSPTRDKIIAWITQTHPTFRPTIIRLSKSAKNLSALSMAPKLGTDTTLPQHRTDTTPAPHQDQYPVWYFFYGNLAKPDELQRRLGLSCPPVYVPASVAGGRIRSWRGRYRALVDAGLESTVEGSAFLVRSREHEDVLRFYETEVYEVVRCDVDMFGRSVPGLVFRFVGGDEELV